MKKVTKAVIPAAGLGTRVLPATKAMPKGMLPLVDKPAIQYLVEEAVRSGITDILREYLSTRYPVKALEMTSQEILDRMIRESLPEKSIKRLKDILITADFVKFAKFTPDADQNETVYTDAYYFIEETKAVEVEQPAVEIEPIKTEEKKEDDA